MSNKNLSALFKNYRELRQIKRALNSIAGHNECRDILLNSTLKTSQELVSRIVTETYQARRAIVESGHILEDHTVLFTENLHSFIDLAISDVRNHDALPSCFHYETNDGVKTLYASQCSELCDVLYLTDQHELNLL